jgi:hypothetical protein
MIKQWSLFAHMLVADDINILASMSLLPFQMSRLLYRCLRFVSYLLASIKLLPFQMFCLLWMSWIANGLVSYLLASMSLLPF